MSIKLVFEKIKSITFKNSEKIKIIIILLLLYYLEIFKWINYFIIFIIILIYKILRKELEKKMLKKKISNKMLYILICISDYGHILLWLINKIEKKVFYSKSKNKKKIIISMLIPFKIILYKYYIILKIFFNKSLLISKILIMTYIIMLIKMFLELENNIYIIIWIYILCVIISYYYYYIKDEKEKTIFYINLIDIWDERREVSFLCKFIDINYFEKTEEEKYEFLKKYGHIIQDVRFEAWQISCVENIEFKKRILNMKNIRETEDLLKKVYKDEMQYFLGETVDKALRYYSELEFIKILYKTHTFVLKEYEMEQLIKDYKIILRILLFLYWELKDPEKTKIEFKDGLCMYVEDIKEIYLEQYKMSLEDYRELYNIMKMIDTSVAYIREPKMFETHITFWKVIMKNVKIISNEEWPMPVEEEVVVIKEWQNLLKDQVKNLEKEYKKGLFMMYFKILWNKNKDYTIFIIR